MLLPLQSFRCNAVSPASIRFFLSSLSSVSLNFQFGSIVHVHTVLVQWFDIRSPNSCVIYVCVRYRLMENLTFIGAWPAQYMCAYDFRFESTTCPFCLCQHYLHFLESIELNFCCCCTMEFFM